MRSLVIAIGVALSVAGGCAGSGGDSNPGPDPPLPSSGARTADRLLFACVGDTRPAVENDTAGYPTNVIGSLYAGIQALEPRPPFVVTTGDYLFASTDSSSGAAQAAAQLDLYLKARAIYAGALFPALGNHECTGATASNCGPGAADGVTPNYAAFVEKMLGPLGATEPYYAVEVASRSGAWTAKIVFVAANAWSTRQERWLDAELSRATTYTFVVRHEPAEASTAPGVLPSEALMAAHPYTLSIVGHTHTYRHDAAHPREVLIGNGGAPLSAKDYGFGIFSQRSDGAIVVDMIDWRTGQADPAFGFAVRADGSPVP